MDNKIKKYDRDEGFFPSLYRYFNDDLLGGFGEKYPAVNVTEKKKSFDIELEVPGFEKGDVSIEIDKNVLKISAQNSSNNEEKDEEGRVLRQEFSSSSFSRSFVLPENIDTEKISAKQKNGVVTIKLPKLEKAPEDMVKKIEVK